MEEGSSKTTVQEQQQIPRGNLAQIALGSRLRCDDEECLGAQNDCHKDCNGGFELSSAPESLVSYIARRCKFEDAYAIVVPVEIRLPLEFLGTWLAANHRCAWVWVFALWIVGLHV